MSELDRELERLEADLANGIISVAEFNAAFCRLEREAREDARERAGQAYDDEARRP